MPSTMAECREIQRWIAEGREERLPTVTRDQLVRHLEFLASVLPRKAVDTDTGRDSVAVYFRMLSAFTDAAIAYMSERIIATHKWFPTPSECLAVMVHYRAPPPAKEVARHNVQAFLQARMESFLERLARELVDQTEIDAQPDQWKRIAENNGLLRLTDDGGYVQRTKAWFAGGHEPGLFAEN